MINVCMRYLRLFTLSNNNNYDHCYFVIASFVVTTLSYLLSFFNVFFLQQLAICCFHTHFGLCAFKGAYPNEIAHYADIQIYLNKLNVRICG